MEEYLNLPIKTVIARFPEVASVLNDYNIGCVPCSVGSCLLKDIVTIHNLKIEDQEELLWRIEKIIHPERKISARVLKPPATERSAPASLKYSPPLEKLVREHKLIKRLIALIPYIIKVVEESSKIDRELILDSVYFIRNYADKFHHAKEEDILFGYVDKNLDIIKAMLDDHVNGRDHVQAVIKAIDDNDKASIVKHLNEYKELLLGHIKKEDEILYPWIDRGLSMHQVGELADSFSQAEAEFKLEVVKKCENIVEDLEKRKEKK